MARRSAARESKKKNSQLALQRALDSVGTRSALASALDISPDLLDIWLTGNAAPPREVVAAALALATSPRPAPSRAPGTGS